MQAANAVRSHLGRCTVASALLVVLATLAGCVKQKGVRWREPAFASSWNLRVGSGAEYRATCQWGSPTVVEIAIVGEEEIGTREAYWLEISSRVADSPAEAVLKTLFYLNRNQVVFFRGALQLPGYPAAELPESSLFTWTRGELALISGYVEPYAALGNPCPTTVGDTTCYIDLDALPAELPKSEREGSAALDTPAGTFASQRWRFRGSSSPWRPEGRPIEVWLASDAGPFGLVKAQMRDPSNYNSNLNLVRVLADARDKITGPPVWVQRNKLRDWVLQPKDPLLQVCFPQVGLPYPLGRPYFRSFLLRPLFRQAWFPSRASWVVPSAGRAGDRAAAWRKRMSVLLLERGRW